MVAKMVEVIKVTPFSSNSTAAFTLPLTYFDIIWLKSPPVERIFFYQITGLTSDSFNSVLLPKLKHSLSLTLLHYLPLAGNIIWPQDTQHEPPAISYFPDDAVSVTVAVSNADFNLLSGNGIRNNAEFHHLVPQLSISEDKAEVIAVQITLFPNEGFSIGVSSHHAVLDGKSSTMFLKSWAYLCKQLQQSDEEQSQNPSLLPELIPVYDRTVIKDPKGLFMVYLNRWLNFESNKRSLKVLPSPGSRDVNKLVRATFELTREDIRKLRDKVNEIEVMSGEAKQLHLSTFVISLAYAYVCVVKAKREEANRDVVYGFTADYRSRLDPPVPLNYFGNCVGRQAETAKVSDLMQENGFGLAFVVDKFSDLIKEIDADAIEGSDLKIRKVMTMLSQGALMLSVAGSTHFNVYGSDFGWGKPKKVEIVSIDSAGAVALAESRDGVGGVEIGVALDEQEMKIFASVFVDGLTLTVGDNL